MELSATETLGAIATSCNCAPIMAANFCLALAIYSFKEISTDYLPYTGVHQPLRLCSLFYRLLCRVAIVLTSKVAACSTSSSLDQRPRVKRSAPSAVSRDDPIANNTGEGSVLPS